MTRVAGPRVEWIVSQGRHQTIPFRDMGIMTLAAIQPDSGLAKMLGKEVLLLHVMAIEANPGHRSDQKRGLLTAVGVMAVKAFPVGGGWMGPAGLHPVLQFLVAQITESASALDQQTVEVSSVGQMTPGTLSADKRRMLAAGPSNTQINIVAFGAKLGLAGHQQAFFHGTMRQMTVVAFPVFIGNVDQFSLDRGVAIPADFVLVRFQEPRPTRLVGVMAGYAFTPQDRFVNRRQGQPLTRLVMALGTHLAMGIDCQPRVIRTMRQMATQAIIVLERGMNDFHLSIARLHGVAAEAQVAGRTSQQVVRHHTVSLVALEAIVLYRRMLGGLDHLILDVAVAFETDLPAAGPQQRRA